MGILQGKAIIITGGSGDIGHSTAAQFIDQGATVLLVARNAGRIQEIAAEIGAGCHYFAADITSPEQVTAMTEYAVDVLGGIDVLVANAGISGPIAALPDYPVSDFENILAVNVTGTWLCLRSVIPVMRKQARGGSIIITSSGAGLFGLANLSGYVTSKHALTGLMRSAALECADANIRVNLLCPGPVKSTMTDAIGAEFGMSAEDYEKIVCETIPMRRYASLAEVANMMQFLASDASCYCTGSVFPLDGGKAMY